MLRLFDDKKRVDMEYAKIITTFTFFTMKVIWKKCMVLEIF